MDTTLLSTHCIARKGGGGGAFPLHSPPWLLLSPLLAVFQTCQEVFPVFQDGASKEDRLLKQVLGKSHGGVEIIHIKMVSLVFIVPNKLTDNIIPQTMGTNFSPSCPPRVNIEINDIGSGVVCQNSELNPPFYRLIFYKLADARSVPGHYHALIASYMLPWLVQQLTPLLHEIHKTLYLT